MLKKSLATIAAIVLIGVAVQAEAATWTVSATGVITEGVDIYGYFGVAGQDLTGFTFTQTISATVIPSSETTTLTTPYSTTIYGDGQAWRDEITINGVSHVWEGVRHLANQTISDAVSVSGPSYLTDAISTSVAAWINGGWSSLTSNIAVQSSTVGFVPSLDFNQQLSMSTSSGLWATSQTYIDNILWFNGSVDQFSVNIPIAPVPEPETYAMLLAGLGLVGFAARRKRTAA
ncbi:FxDxF family PEP-CTERM protein [Duganella guangzhouensis]|uniref:FxDxF family PEP-CTERM protein n=1 Tax=Duganella guangzhouensis TaxID=2666084 RepID=UPI001E62EE15|nr:FxDxF family PEP-CTERM protein [Duganella guangzhouensis]